MSALIYFTDVTQALIATDTLAVSDEEGTPAYWTTKAFIVPHLQMVICGTGVSGFAGQWFTRVNDRMILKDIVHLDNFAPGALRKMWAQRADGDGPGAVVRDKKFTTTIYHFGFSREDNQMKTCVYRSTNDFQSEWQGPGFAVKPPCEVPAGIRFPTDLPALMREQRRVQMTLPAAERVYIGGEVNCIHLTRQGFTSVVLDRFEDFDAMEWRMFS